MKMPNMLIATLIAATAGLAAAPALAQHHGHQFIEPKDLKWGTSPTLPGAQVAVLEGPLNEAKPFILRIRFPANYRLAPHFHTAIEHVTVISGEFSMGAGETFDERKVTPLGPGAVAIMQPKTPHYALTTVPTEVQVHGVGPWTLTFVNPKDDPRIK